MAGQLVIDFDNAYTVAAYWRQASRRAETLYVPGVMRPMSGSAAGKGKIVYAAPTRIAYSTVDGGCLIGQEAIESDQAEDVFHDLQFAVVTGKQVNSLAGNRWLSGQDMAKDYLAAIISQSAQVLGLGSESVLAFTVPLAICNSAPSWRRYRRWLTGAVKQAGFNRLELVEEPWAAAWGAGMKVKPGDVYIVVRVNAEFIEAAMVQAVSHASDGNNGRHVRVLTYRSGWLANEEMEVQPQQEVAVLLRQILRQAGLLGYSAGSLAGVVVIGSAIKDQMLFAVQEIFPNISIYDKQPLAAAACGAAILTAGVDGSGYLQHSYGLRHLTEAGYQYREFVSQGLFYPSDGPVTEFTLKASYDGQREFALLIYRMEEQCMNEDSPLLLITKTPAVKGQPVITVKASLDGAGQLVVTAYELANGDVIVNNITAAKLV